MQSVKHSASERLWHVGAWCASAHVASSVGSSTARSWRDEESVIVGSSCCAQAIAAKSMELDEACRVSTSTQDKAAAAALDEPLRMWDMSKVPLLC